jgi:hypothetical protein
MTLRNLEAIALSAGGSLDEIVKGSAFRAELRDILVEIDAVLYLPHR